MPLSMEQIIRNTDQDRIERARLSVRVVHLKLNVSKSTKLPLAIAQTYSKDRLKDGTVKYYKYNSFILFLPNKKVKISCSCSDFKFCHEMALTKKGSSDVFYSNGETPDIKNPLMVPSTCKHLIALWDLLVSKKLVVPAQKYANKVKNPTPNAITSIRNPNFKNTI
jgi:hypothetical protein